MNKKQKIILFNCFLLIIFGVVATMLFPSLISSFVFVIYSIIVIITAFFYFYYASKISTSTEEPATRFNTSNQILFSAGSVFPFQLFPDRYFIQEKTVSIVRKQFFSQGWSETISIKDIGGIRLYTGPLFASITIIRKVLPQTTVELRNLWKKDAIKLKEILDGLIITENNLVNIPKKIPLKIEKKILFEIGTQKEIEKEI